MAFGGGGVIAENDRGEQRKIIKYNHLLANCLIFHNVCMMTRALYKLRADGMQIEPEAVARSAHTSVRISIGSACTRSISPASLPQSSTNCRSSATARHHPRSLQLDPARPASPPKWVKNAGIVAIGLDLAPILYKPSDRSLAAAISECLELVVQE